MENNGDQRSIKENILATIKSGRVKMRPKWHFVLSTFLAALGAVILLLFILYLASFIIFALRQTGVLFMPAFGLEGWYSFFANLPRFLILLLMVFVFALEFFVKRYAFAYRRPLLYSALGIFVLVIAGALAVENSSFHRSISEYAENNEETLTGKFYHEFEQQNFRDVHRGMVIEMINSGFMMRDRRKEVLTIIVTPRTRLPFGADFSQGDIVVVFGNRDNGIVRAFGIQKVGE